MRTPILSPPVLRREARRYRDVGRDPLSAVTLSQEFAEGVSGDDDDFTIFAALDAGTELPLEVGEDALDVENGV